jgi:DNA-binding protein Fis
MSNTTQAFAHFMALAGRDPAKSPHVGFVDGAQNGRTSGDWAKPGEDTQWNCWRMLDARLAGLKKQAEDNLHGIISFAEIEKALVGEVGLAVLDLNGGNQTRTAEQLGIGSATLYRKLKSYGIVRGTRTPGDEDPAPR